MIHNLLIAILLSSLPLFFFAQDTLEVFGNPSFEDTPKMGKHKSPTDDIVFKHKHKSFIIGWEDCGTIEFPKESAPDIHGSNTNYWDVSQKPSNGTSYLGLTVRELGTYESVGQALKMPFKKNQCYQFKIDLSMSPSYQSQVRNKKRNIHNFSTPTVLYIYGGSELCEESELIYVSPPINNSTWETFTINFQPVVDVNFIKLKAYYSNDKTPYNGNILIDNISEVVELECTE